jgi:hypothetical protein
MNYIKRLEAEAGAKDAKIANVQDQINAFITFLHGDKFAGFESNGDRKDWISTADVIERLREMRSELL